MNPEEAFLQARQAREHTRLAKVQRNATERQEDNHSKDHMMAEFTSLHRDIEKLLDEDKQGAYEVWKAMQLLAQGITNEGSQSVTAFEVRNMDEALSALLTRINDTRERAKKFSFSSKRNVNLRTAAFQSGAAQDTSKQPKPSVILPLPCEQKEAGSILQGMVNVGDRFVASADAVFIRQCSGSVFHLLPSQGSVFISDCADCTFYAACHQLRVKSSSRCHFYVWCGSTPIIENCSEASFGGYEAWTGLVSAPLTQHATHEAWAAAVGNLTDSVWLKNSHRKVDDFQWLKQQHSPNWVVLPEEEWRKSDRHFIA